ncbi:universal stress protein [Geodermatophilus marinus]|uniref:universal stress protein n=1 Tax=Geodermatophilus sp. LHW52908 TaxID=2303986 RepID=UPI000E3D305E|nr:universal stress protein [Geodermatophilus sp. LHW52908]RFU22405.1 universal stress protein [Geodermatophilus sp. LHW52908]
MTTPLQPTAAPRGDDGPTAPVVVGTDGSECALEAVRWAAAEAARRGAPLRIVHAASTAAHRGVAGAAPPGLSRARGVTAQAFTVARHAAPTVTASTETVTGDPVSALLRAAGDAQLVVLGIATTGAPDEMVLAPVAQRVTGRSPLPVVVVPRQRHPAVGGSRPVVAVLGLDRPQDDEPVADFAAAAATHLSRPLLVLHAEHGRPASWTADPEAWAARHPDLTVTHEPLAHPTGGRVLAAACPTPLLVLGAGHGGLLHRAQDSLHRWLLRHCTSPMALVPPPDRRSGLETPEDALASG